jgi:hypothetical protein
MSTWGNWFRYLVAKGTSNYVYLAIGTGLGGAASTINCCVARPMLKWKSGIFR